MSQYARIPASAFAHHQPRRRRSSASSRPAIQLKRAPSSPQDDHYVPRPPAFMSIAYLRDAIAALDHQMAALVRERHDLELKLEQAVRLQAPVLRLPSELLSSIFAMGVLEVEDENPVMVATLMLVCRYWADVALNTPLLWAKITVSAHHSLDRARRRLSRSKSCPLDVSVNFASRTDHGVSDQILRAVDLLRPALWRIKSFTLTVPNAHQAYAAMVRCQDEDAPVLEKLIIHVHHSMQDSFSTASVSASSSASPQHSILGGTRPLRLFNSTTPRLHTCSLTSFNFGWDLKLMTRLRVLELGGYFNASTPSASTLLDILRQCPDLEELSLRNMSDVDTYPCPPSVQQQQLLSTDELLESPAISRIHLPKLKKASFFYSGIAHTREIMRQIAFPNLESLELAYLENVTPLLHLVYSQALTRLPLRHLRIEACLFSELKFINLLKKLSGLTNLELVDAEDVSKHTLKVLSTSRPWPCPRLESITLDGCTSFEWDSLRTLVESRLPSDPTSCKRYHTTTSSISSSASASAAAAEQAKKLKQQQHLQGLDRHGQSVLIAGPPRLRYVDVTRCHQISKEMVQWLRMYVVKVNCESAKGAWVST